MKKSFYALLVLVILILTGCTVTETLSFNRTGGGKSSADINVEPFFIEVLEDFGEFLPQGEQSIMDSAMSGFASQLDKSTSTESVTFRRIEENHYDITFSYSNLSSLVVDLGATNQSIVTETNNSFRFYVDINNYDELTKVVPFLADPNFEVYGPEYNQGTTEEDYLDMIYYLLGEEGPDAIKNGLVTIRLKTPGTITQVNGAKRISSTEAEFTFPIIDFLLLNKPITFSVSWR